MSDKRFSWLTPLLILAVAIGASGQSAPRAGPATEATASESGGAKAVALRESAFPDDYDVIEPAKWRTVKLSIDLSHGGRCDITLLRPLPWLDLTKAKIGGTVDLQMPELGIAGAAKVIAIEPCPEIETDKDKTLPPGKVARPAVGKFVTTNAKVIDLAIEGLDKPIGTTASHPFWSLDRKGWVAASDLKPGEKLRTQDGSATVKSITPRPGTETVYNIEVHKDHTYFVSDAKLWVHNACTPRGRVLSPHYVNDRAARNIPISVLDDTIDNYPGIPGAKGRTVHYSPDNNVTVVLESDGITIVTAHKGRPSSGGG